MASHQEMNGPTQACRNLASGRYFLFIEDGSDGKLLLVIPTGEVKLLDASLFGEIEDIVVTDFLSDGLLTQQQIAGYKKFVEKDSVRLFKEIVASVTDSDDLTEKFQLAEKSMSQVQYRFALNRWLDRLRSSGKQQDS